MTDTAVRHVPDAKANTRPDDSIPKTSLSPLAVLLIEFALAVGGFGIGTGEFVIMGLLPNVAETYQVSIPTAGYVISAYALGVVIGAPIIAILSARLPRRTLLLALMGVFAVGNILSAMAPSFWSFTALRFVTGLPHGAYFGVASLVAASMVPPNKRARAVGRVMLGLTIATLLGTPLATFMGQMLSWRSAFYLVGFIGLLTVALVWFFQPRDKVQEGASIRRELSAFGKPQVWLTLGIASVGFGGMFSVFSYIASTTTQTAGLPVTMVSIVIALFGIALGNGMVLVSFLDRFARTRRDVDAFSIEAAVMRAQPVLMTATTTGLGLMPLLFASGIGSEVQRPLAAVVIGGLVTSTVLTLLVLPAVYKWFAPRPVLPEQEEPV